MGRAEQRDEGGRRRGNGGGERGARARGGRRVGEARRRARGDRAVGRAAGGAGRARGGTDGRRWAEECADRGVAARGVADERSGLCCGGRLCERMGQEGGAAVLAARRGCGCSARRLPGTGRGGVAKRHVRLERPSTSSHSPGRAPTYRYGAEPAQRRIAAAADGRRRRTPATGSHNPAVFVKRGYGAFTSRVRSGRRLGCGTAVRAPWPHVPVRVSRGRCVSAGAGIGPHAERFSRGGVHERVERHGALRPPGRVPGRGVDRAREPGGDPRGRGRRVLPGASRAVPETGREGSRPGRVREGSGKRCHWRLGQRRGRLRTCGRCPGRARRCVPGHSGVLPGGTRSHPSPRLLGSRAMSAASACCIAISFVPGEHDALRAHAHEARELAPRPPGRAR